MIDPSDYARQVETYLCQKNRGHLVRVVGPAFELVCGWAQTGVPLKVAFRGIDRCCERREGREGRGGGRRPVRIEFCKADVLDAFDDWRRAVGVAALAPAEETETAARKPALGAHLERIVARLANIRGVGAAATDLQRHIEDVIREIEQLLPSALRARGDARAAIVARLDALDDALIEVAIRGLDAGRAEALRREAAEELAPFGGRMPADARARAYEAAFRRLAREAAGLPVIRYE